MDFSRAEFLSCPLELSLCLVFDSSASIMMLRTDQTTGSRDLELLTCDE